MFDLLPLKTELLVELNFGLPADPHDPHVHGLPADQIAAMVDSLPVAYLFSRSYNSSYYQ